MSLNKPNKIQIIKYAPPPPDLPTLGKSDPSDVVFIGRTNYVASLEEKKFVFGLKNIDRSRHMYIIGKSGIGKTKIQELMIRQDIAYGRGVCFIDLYGGLINDILDFIPRERINDVCLIDPSDTNYSPSFNPFSGVDMTFRHQFTQGFVEIFHKQFGSNWSPKIEHVFRFIILALLDYPRATVHGIIDILIDSNYRQIVVSHIKDEIVKKFWTVDFNDSDTTISIINKLEQFLSDPMIHNIFNQEDNKINIENLMNEKKIILINLSKGKIGEENSSLLGSILLFKIKQAGISRAKYNKNINDLYLYIDDFHSIANDSFENILSESRNYGINLILAHQYIGQLSSKTQQAVMGNVGSIILFRVGGDDAAKLKAEFSPVFDIKDMINLGIGEFYIKMIIDGESYDPFSAETLRVLPPTHPSYREEIIKSSHDKYSILVDNNKMA